MSKKQAKREAKQLLRLCRVNDLLDESLARTVAGRVAATGYRGSLEVLSQFLRLVRLDVSRHTANVESAAPLPGDLQAVIQTSLTQRYGLGLNTIFGRRPSLIGGVRIQVGSDVFDGSVLARLTLLKKSF
jgi:F-type H+-transporting ATPase subunit delta